MYINIVRILYDMDPIKMKKFLNHENKIFYEEEKKENTVRTAKIDDNLHLSILNNTNTKIYRLKIMFEEY